MPIDKYHTETAKNVSMTAVFLIHWKARLWFFLYPYYSHSSPSSTRPSPLLEEPKEIKLLQKFLVGKKAEMEQHISLLVIKISKNISTDFLVMYNWNYANWICPPNQRGGKPQLRSALFFLTAVLAWRLSLKSSSLLLWGFSSCHTTTTCCFPSLWLSVSKMTNIIKCSELNTILWGILTRG